MVWMPLAWMPPSGVPVVLKSQFYGLTIVIECVKRVILKAHVGHYEAQPKFKLLPVYRIPICSHMGLGESFTPTYTCKFFK